jgi:DNA-binding beta-propeller fold protein YncE
MKQAALCLVLLCTCCLHAANYRFVRAFGESGGITQSNTFFMMDGIAVDRFGHVFVADWYNDSEPYQDPYGPVCVKRFTTGGVFELFWPTEEYGSPAGIDCACNGDPFVCAGIDEGLGRRIEHFTPVGVLLNRLGDDYDNTFRDVAVSGDGHVYGVLYRRIVGAADTTVVEVVKFPWIGTNWGPMVSVRVTNEHGFSAAAWGIDADPWRQRVYVTVLASNGMAGVKVYDMDLALQDTWGPWGYAAQPVGVAVDNRDGAVLVCDALSNLVYKYDRNGDEVCTFGGPGEEPGRFNRPSDLDVDMHGWVFVADADNYRVQVFAPPEVGNLNFIVNKSKIKVNWKQKAKGKDRDVIVAKGIAAVDVYTNTFGLAATPLNGMLCSFYFDDLAIIDEMTPTKTDKKGLKALYKPDKNHKLKLIYRPRGALVLVKAKLKRGNVDGPLGIVDAATLPPWEWVTAELMLSDEFLGVHYMRFEHVNKVGKKYKATKK